MEDEEDNFWKKPTEYHSYINMKICGYINMIFCIATIISNVFVVAVFTRKSIISPINTILTHMAITESLTILAYTPRSWHELFRVAKCSIQEHRTYVWEMLSCSSLSMAFFFRQISILLGVILALWRYIAIAHPLKERRWCNMEITRKMIAGAYGYGILSGIPPFFTLNVEPMERLLDQNGCSVSNSSILNKTTIIYEMQFSLEKIPAMYFVGALSYGFFMKVLPSFIIGALSYRLVLSLIQMKAQRNEIIVNTRKNTYSCKMKQKISEQANRTTTILLIILALFVLAEAPNGIFLILTAYYGPPFFWRYYYYAMEIFNSLTHISVSFNFLIYYSMSSQFRDTFKTLFRSKGGTSSGKASTQTSRSSLPEITKPLENLNTIQPELVIKHNADIDQTYTQG